MAIKLKVKEGAQAVCNCADFQLGLWITANSVGNINTTKPWQKRRKRLLADEKGPHHFGMVVVYVSILIHLLHSTHMLLNAFKKKEVFCSLKNNLVGYRGINCPWL